MIITGITLIEKKWDKSEEKKGKEYNVAERKQKGINYTYKV